MHGINKVSCVNSYVWNCAFKDVLKLFKEGLVRIDCGSAFHNFEAEYEIFHNCSIFFYIYTDCIMGGFDWLLGRFGLANTKMQKINGSNYK